MQLSVRLTKRILLVLAVLIVLLELVHAYMVFVQKRHGDFEGFLVPLMVLVMVWSLWARISNLEAEHGPDYVQPTSPRQRAMVIAIAVVGLAVGLVAALVAVRLH
jgi:hypothetical protein